MKFSLQTLLGVALCLLPETQAQSEENARIMAELGPLLSKGAAISLPSSAAWEELMIRAAGPRIAPNFAASVEVTTEADVQNTVSYKSLELFLHGLLTVRPCRSNMQTSMVCRFSRFQALTDGWRA